MAKSFTNLCNIEEVEIYLSKFICPIIHVVGMILKNVAKIWQIENIRMKKQWTSRSLDYI